MHRLIGQISSPRAALTLLGLIAVGLLLAAPVLGLLISALRWDQAAADALRQMAQTVLPEYALTSVLLCVGVALGVGSMGVVSACAVTLFEFPGRKWLEWALLLPLAMPAYVLAYAYTDFFQFSGVAQSVIRSMLGVEGRVLPEIRSLPGAVLVLSLALYPYVYLLVRAALLDRAAHVMEAARLLGAPLRRRITRVALPMARPALAAGIALALMETLADYGVVSYFGVQTFTTGIYKAWLALDNRVAAVQLAVILLVVVAVLLKLEQRAQARMRFASAQSQGARGAEARPLRLQGWHAALACMLCAMPVLLGFLGPLLAMLAPLMRADTENWPSLARFAQWAWNSLRLGLLAAGLTVVLALALSHAKRQVGGWLVTTLLKGVGLGYAVPGAVIVVGLLMPMAWLQSHGPQGPGVWGPAMLTTTVLGLLWAYSVRFSAVALQPIQAGYAQIASSMDESARLMGASGKRIWRDVHWPQLRRPALAAALLVFVDTMKELPATLVLRPFNSDTLAVMAYQLAKDERLSEAALPSLAIVLVGLAPVWLLSRALKR
jgi:iron(III) transport system permease protein